MSSFHQQKQTDLSLQMYEKALEAASGQKEIEFMCQYEIGKCCIYGSHVQLSVSLFTLL